jgi:hypothetical protein
MAGNDRSLQGVGAASAEREREGKSGEAASNEELIPPPSILIQEQDRVACLAHARRRPRSLNLHQGDEAVHLGLARREPRENAAETERLVAQGRAHPVVARGRRVPLVEHEVDDS